MGYINNLKSNKNTQKNSESKRSTEVTIAMIGLAGVLTTGFLSNLDKIFPDPQIIKVTYSGYRPTDNFETELRHYFNVSGTRATIEGSQTHLLNSLRKSLLKKNISKEKANKMVDIAIKESPSLDEIIVEFMPIYKKFFSLEELQELNKFYSTETMQNLVKKIPALTKDIAPIQVELIEKIQKRMFAAFEKMEAKSEEKKNNIAN